MLTKELRAEHHDILAVLNVLEAMCDQLEEGKELVRGDQELLLDFLQTFVGLGHHPKEDKGLFPALEEEGVIRKEAVRSLAADHETSREHLARMTRAVQEGHPTAEAFVEAGREYVKLLRDHVRREDMDVFPVADRDLPAEVQLGVQQEFDRIGREELGEAVHQEMHRIARHLVARHGAPFEQL